MMDFFPILQNEATSSVNENINLKPFFTIGVTTYKRHELLRQLLKSILCQTFTDFEVIVGNDCISDALSSDIIRFNDPRIRFVNNSKNLGEIANMNSLLGLSKGRYFTWQFDDDLYAPNFLETVYSAIVKYNAPKCVYTSYGFVYGESFPNISRKHCSSTELFSGREFIRRSLMGKMKVVGCCGVFETGGLMQLGGVKDLCGSPIGAHSEHMLLVNCGLLETVAFADSPLVFSRGHKGSWSSTNAEAELYKKAGLNLIRESVNVLSMPQLRQDFHDNVYSLFNLSINIFIGKLIARNGKFIKSEVTKYISDIKRQLSLFSDLAMRQIALDQLDRVSRELRILPVMKAMLKRKAPELVDWVYEVRAFVSQCKFLGRRN